MVVGRYLFFQFTKSILSVLLFTLMLYYTLTYMEDAQRYFPGHQPVSGRTVFLYYFWQLPAITIQLLPFTVLIGALITNWMLARHGEVAALRAAGVSMMRLSRPALLVGLIFAAGQFALSEFVLPSTSVQFSWVRSHAIEHKNVDHIFSKSKWLHSASAILHYDRYDEVKQILVRPEIFIYGKRHAIERVVHARAAHFERGKNRWVCDQAIETVFLQDSVLSTVRVWNTFLTDVDFAPPQVLKQDIESSQLSYWQLNRIVSEAQAVGTNVADRLVDLYLKLSAPFANVLFILMTLPFALRKERQEDNYLGVVLCLAAALFYWFGGLFLKNLALKGVLHPLLAAWSMTVVLAVFCFFLVRRLDEGQ